MDDLEEIVEEAKIGIIAVVVVLFAALLITALFSL